MICYYYYYYYLLVIHFRILLLLLFIIINYETCLHELISMIFRSMAQDTSACWWSTWTVARCNILQREGWSTSKAPGYPWLMNQRISFREIFTGNMDFLPWKIHRIWEYFLGVSRRLSYLSVEFIRGFRGDDHPMSSNMAGKSPKVPEINGWFSIAMFDSLEG